MTSPARAANFALLGTRVLVTAIFWWHGIPKAFDPARAMEKFVGFGLPGVLGPVTGVVEVLAGALLLTGWLGRAAAGVLGVIIVGAIVTVQLPNGITEGLERDLLILGAIVVLLTHGTGAYSVDGTRLMRREELPRV